MRLLTVLAAAVLVAGLYHYRRHHRARMSRSEKMDEQLAHAVPGVAQGTNLIDITEPIGDLGPMQSGIATGA